MLGEWLLVDESRNACKQRLVDVIVAPATVVPTSRDRQQSAEHSNPPYLRQVSDHTGGKPIARAKALGLKVTHFSHPNWESIRC